MQVEAVVVYLTSGQAVRYETKNDGSVVVVEFNSLNPPPPIITDIIHKDVIAFNQLIDQAIDIQLNVLQKQDNSPRII